MAIREAERRRVLSLTSSTGGATFDGGPTAAWREASPTVGTPRRWGGVARSLRLEFDGEVSQKQEMLDGTRQVVLEGSADGDDHASWAITVTLAWTMGDEAEIEEGDLALSRDDGSEVYASLRAGRYRESGLPGLEGAAEGFEAAFNIDGGEGAFASSAGSVRLRGTFTDERFAATADVRMK